MTRREFLNLLGECPIIASVQTQDGSAVDDPKTLARLARASIDQGVKVVRAQGVQNLLAIREATNAPTIGLIKRSVPGTEVYITPTTEDIRAVASTGAEIVAIDATDRPRPVSVNSLVEYAHALGLLVIADCDSMAGLDSDADIYSTTLSGYTGSSHMPLPDLKLVRALASANRGPVLAEGRYSTQHQVRAALLMGAQGVVIGGALNDPVKQTRVFCEAARSMAGQVAAFDIGGTWLRFAIVDRRFKIESDDRIPLPSIHADRITWMRKKLAEHPELPIGISSGGTIDPKSRTVIEASELIPEYVGASFRDQLGRKDLVALNDGLASAWGHSCLPEFVNNRVATLAFGTGVGFGIVEEGRLLMGRHGEYPRINDLACGNGQSIEDSLNRAGSDRAEMIEYTIRLVDSLYQPDVIAICGGKATELTFQHPKAVMSPFGGNAGLCGAAGLVLYPPFGGQI